MYNIPEYGLITTWVHDRYIDVKFYWADTSILFVSFSWIKICLMILSFANRSTICLLNYLYENWGSVLLA